MADSGVPRAILVVVNTGPKIHPHCDEFMPFRLKRRWKGAQVRDTAIRTDELATMTSPYDYVVRLKAARVESASQDHKRSRGRYRCKREFDQQQAPNCPAKIPASYCLAPVL